MELLYSIKTSLKKSTSLTDEQIDITAKAIIKDVHADPNQYMASAMIVLEDSNSFATYGLVKDYNGNFEWKKGEGDTIGHWNKAPDGNIRLSLTTPLESLVDKVNERYEFYQKMRAEGTRPVKGSYSETVPRTITAPVQPIVKPVVSEADQLREAKLQALKDMLMGNK